MAKSRLEVERTSEAVAECAKGAIAKTVTKTTRASNDLLMESSSRGVDGLLL